MKFLCLLSTIIRFQNPGGSSCWVHRESNAPECWYRSCMECVIEYVMALTNLCGSPHVFLTVYQLFFSRPGLAGKGCCKNYHWHFEFHFWWTFEFPHVKVTRLLSCQSGNFGTSAPAPAAPASKAASTAQKSSDLIFQPPKVGKIQLCPDDLLAVYEPKTQGVILVTRKQYDQVSSRLSQLGVLVIRWEYKRL